MTREEASEALSVLKTYDAPWLREAIDMAIEALSAEVKGDLISRQWLLDLCAIPKDGEGVDWKVPLEVVRQNIIDAPSAKAVSDDLIIKGAKGIKDGLYNIQDGKLFKYKANGGTVRTYPIVPSAEAEWIPVTKDGCNFPPYSEFVLVWVNDGHEIASYEYDPKAGADFWSMDAYELYGKNIWKVKAWMPLPKPYREDGEA